jgi:hypothetical protein
MLDGGQNALQGRCPTCSQSVTLAADAGSRDVECPRCHFQGAGTEFLAEDAPLPVIEVARDTGRARPSSRAPDKPDERTHLILSPLDVQDEQTIAPGSDLSAQLSSALAADRGAAEAPLRAGAPDEARTRLVIAPSVHRSAVPDEARTHLLLDADDVKDVKEGTVVSLSHLLQKPASEPRPAPEDERTRLFIGSLDLSHVPRQEAPRTPSKFGSLAPQALGVGARLDELMHGHYRLALALVAGACGLLAPFFDYVRDGRVAVLSVLASFALLTGYAAFALAWLSRWPTAAGDFRWGAVGQRLATSVELFAFDLKQVDRSPNYLKVDLVGRALTLLGLLGLGLTSLFTLLALVFSPSVPPSGLRVLSGIILGAGLVLMQSAMLTAPVAAPAPEDLAECVAAAAKLPAILDLSEPLPSAFIGGHTPLHRCLVALSQWRARHLPDEVACRAALERHLQRELPGCRIEREKWLGHALASGVADIVIDDMLVIQVARGFDDSRAPRALQQLDRQVQSWPGKPVILAVFDAARPAVFDSAAGVSLLERHQRNPLIAARMPVY